MIMNIDHVTVIKTHEYWTVTIFTEMDGQLFDFTTKLSLDFEIQWILTQFVGQEVLLIDKTASSPLERQPVVIQQKSA